MRIKKMAASVLALMMVASMAACGAGGTPSNGGGTAESAGGTGDNGGTTGGDVTLTFMGWEASPLETQAVENGIKKFEEQNPGIKIKYTPTGSGDDYNAKLLSSIAGNSQPDVFFCGAESYRGYVKKGALLDITDRFGGDFALDDFIPSSKTIMQVDGKVYGISSCNVSPIIYYNKDIFDAAKEPYPSSDPAKCWTIDEFREVAKRLTTDEVYGCYGLEQNATQMSGLLATAGVSRFNEDYTKSGLNNDAAKKVLTTIRDIREVDKSAPASSTLENAGMNAAQMLQTGKVAMLLDGSWALQELSTMDFPIGIAPIPSFGEVTTVGQAHLHAIGTQSKNQEEAWTYLKFLAGMDYQGQLCKEGLWLPNRLSMWEEGPDGLDGWYDKERLGEDYLNMKEYLRDVRVDPLAMQPTSMCSDIFNEETDKFFKEGQDVDTTLANIETRTNEAIAEANAG